MTKHGLSHKERFEMYYIPEPNSGCWIWLGWLSADGYGVFSYWDQDRGKILSVRAHRFSYKLSHGSLPKGRCICHRCDTPLCVNPDHLFAGTNRENQIDSVLKGRSGRQKLTADKVMEIKQAISNGAGTNELARRYKVDSSTISNIKKKRVWRHIS